MSDISLNDFAEKKQLMIKVKEYIPAVITIAVSLVIILVLILPQVQAYFDAKSQDDAKRQEILILKNNVEMLAQLSDNDLTKQFNIAAQALPSEKNFIDILSSVADAANKSNIALSDYSFNVGKISSKTEDSSKPATLEVKLTVTGTADRISKFLDTMQKEFPMSEAVNIAIDESSSSSISFNFYYEPLQKITFDSKAPLSQLSQQNRNTLSTLGSWQ